MVVQFPLRPSLVSLLLEEQWRRMLECVNVREFKV